MYSLLKLGTYRYTAQVALPFNTVVLRPAGCGLLDTMQQNLLTDIQRKEEEERTLSDASTNSIQYATKQKNTN
jgi:hypothetical protein